MAAKRQTQEKKRQGGGRQKSSARSGQLRRTNGDHYTDGQQQGGLLNVDAEQLAQGLGWFSIGLGLAEVLAPRGVAKVAGLQGKNTGLIRLFGLREIASGIAIFMQGKRPAAAVWSRVAGDALDIACLGASFASPRTNKGRLAFATANVLTVTALDVLCAQQLSAGQNGQQSEEGSTHVKRSIVINSTPAELYQFWHNFENLPRFMQHLESVTVTGAGRSHWVAKAPGGTTVEWDAEVTEDRPNELIAWRSLENADVYNAGSVEFEATPGGRGTIIRVELSYDPPGGVIGKTVAKLFGEEPGQQIYDDLRNLKQVIETGEIVLSDGTVWSNGLLTQRPAQPLSQAASGQAEIG
ncbi:MAG TPA: SRPBCC family protein [Pyrinomonadaceae bacterium]